MGEASDKTSNIYEYIITSIEEEEYAKDGIISDRLQRFWSDFVDKLPTKYQEEARKKKFTLVSHNRFPENTSRGFYYNLMFEIPKASEELKKYIAEMDENIIICMRDPI